MHSKLQLLAHPTHLRVVVPSANLVSHDWGESGVMENVRAHQAGCVSPQRAYRGIQVVFLIDLPRLPEGQLTDPVQLTHFGEELLYFVKAMGLDQGTIDSMRRFDFSRTAHLAFVHSM